MPREFSRVRRIEEQLRRDLADLIHTQVKEPVSSMISIAEVRVSGDLSMARIYISVLGEDRETIDHNIAILQNAAGRLRHILGKRMHVKRTPRLQFIRDDVIQQGAALNNLIEKAIHRDQKKAEACGSRDTVPGEGDNG